MHVCLDGGFLVLPSLVSRFWRSEHIHIGLIPLPAWATAGVVSLLCNYHHRYIGALSSPPYNLLVLQGFIPLLTLDTFDQSLNAELAASTAFSKSITPDSGYLHNASPVLGFNVSANLPSSGGTNSPLMKL